MTKVSVHAEFDAPPRQLWEVIGGFNALPDWHPGVTASTIEYGDGGTVRVLESAEGGRIVERIENVEYRGHAYTYSLVEGDLPVSRYVATLRVTKAKRAGRARAEWTAEFAAEGAPATDVAKACEGFCRAGFDNLAHVMAARPAPPPAGERRERGGPGRRKGDSSGRGKRR